MRLAFAYFDWSEWTAGTTFFLALFGALKALGLDDRPEIVLLIPEGLKSSSYTALTDVIDATIETPLELLEPSPGSENAPHESERSLPQSPLSSLLKEHQVDVLFATRHFGQGLTIPLIAWIPDFQHLHLPEMFSLTEISARNEEYLRLAELATLMMVTCNEVKNDFAQFAPEHAGKARVLPFQKGVAQAQLCLDPVEIARTYNLPEKFIFLPNQFWKHKNHTLVVEALRIARDKNKGVTVVSTGLTKDYRHPEHFDRVLQQIACDNLRENFILLGLLPRHEEVLALMRRAQAVLQPSLFEGLGMGLSEAMSLGKKVILSDIPTFRQLGPKGASYFDPHDAHALADALIQCNEQCPNGPDARAESQARAAAGERSLQMAESFLSIARHACTLAVEAERAAEARAADHATATESGAAEEPGGSCDWPVQIREIRSTGTLPAGAKRTAAKVLLITPAFPPMRSGGADYALRLAQEIEKAGGSVTVLTSDSENLISDSSLKILPLMKSWGWRQLKTVLKTIASERPDVVNIHFSGWAFNEHPMISFVPNIIRRLHPNVTIVTHIESHVGLRRGRIGRKSLMLQRVLKIWSGKQYSSYEFGTVLKSSHKIIVLSTGDLNVISRDYPDVAAKAVLTPPPAIMPMTPEYRKEALRESVREELRLDKDECLIAFFGYLYPGKGIEPLIEAFRLLLSSGHKLRLMFVGDVPEHYALVVAGRPNYRLELRDKVKEMGLDDRIHWSGYIPSHSDLASRYLRAADLAAVPFATGVQLHRSSFSYLAAHGLPIVSTRGKDTEDIFVHAENVLLCPPENADSLAAALAKVMAEPLLNERLRRGSFKLYQDWYTWDSTVQKTISAYHNDQTGPMLQPLLQATQTAQ